MRTLHAVAAAFAAAFRDGYPHLHIATDAELDSQNDTYYATYYLGLLKPFSNAIISPPIRA